MLPDTSRTHTEGWAGSANSAGRPGPAGQGLPPPPRWTRSSDHPAHPARLTPTREAHRSRGLGPHLSQVRMDPRGEKSQTQAAEDLLPLPWGGGQALCRQRGARHREGLTDAQPQPHLDPKGQLGQMREECTFFLELYVLGLSTTETPLMQPPASRGASLGGSLWSKHPRTLGQAPKLPSETPCGP